MKEIENNRILKGLVVLKLAIKFLLVNFNRVLPFDKYYISILSV